MAYMGQSALSASDLNTRLLAGQVIGGRYRVSHLLGQGGMAAVWAGVNERTGKRVALKVIRPDFLATPGAEAFLHSEGLAASRVNHPNVVTVFDVIEHEGMACIVMELLDGLPLGTYIFRSGSLSLREATSILLPAMRGVAAAHAQGVIHRDLKPQNIFVCIDPDGRVVTTKVLDFGISLMMDWAKVRAIATMPGLVGTPAYMAPEHIEGSDRIDERADVYGFGLLLYESLTGRMPFPGEVQTEVLRRVLTEPPVPLRDLRPDLPATMIGIVDTAMAKSPDQRFVSLNQMISEIEDLVLPSAAVPASGTPAVGVPAAGLSYTVSGPVSIAVPTHVAKENSGLHRETVMFGQAPLKREPEAGAPAAEVADEWSRRLAVVSAAPVSPAAGPSGASPVAGLSEAVTAPSNFPSTEIRLRGLQGIVAAAGRLLRHPAVPPILRDRRVLVGAAAALAILIGTLVATASRGGGRAVPKIPSAQATPAVRPIITVTETSAATVESVPAPSLAVPGSTGTPTVEEPVNRPTVVAPAKPARGEAARAAPAQVGKRGTPRAGTLRVGDF
jgi:eukaryotic-like serine/threonine-protein kinase